jgi:repressor LexA
MEREKLTQTQEKALNFLRNFLVEKGFPPTLREIASHFGLKGPKGPQKTLHILERKGYIRKTPGGSRAIEILKPKIGRRSSLPYAIKFMGITPVPTMIDAHIQDGDFALVKPQKDAENGEIVVALIDDEATIKRIFKKRDWIHLKPANPTMEPIVIKKGEKKVTIVGKVIGIFRKI